MGVDPGKDDRGREIVVWASEVPEMQLGMHRWGPFVGILTGAVLVALGVVGVAAYPGPEFELDPGQWQSMASEGEEAFPGRAVPPRPPALER